MCIAALAWRTDPDLPLIVIANRDERHARATAPLSRWNDGSGIVAGRDLVSGGTWLGISETGRLALITNVHDPDARQADPPSRGNLVGDWLAAGRAPSEISRFDPFNLLLLDAAGLNFVTNNPAPAAAALAAGIHGLSNGPRAAPWPKVAALTALLSERPDSDSLLAAMGPAGTPAGAAHRDALFIADPVYGTRCTTLVTVAADGSGEIVERRYAPDSSVSGETRLDFAWPALAQSGLI